MKILIADDDYAFRTMLSNVLQGLGHETVDAIDGQEAWKIMQQEDAPKLAILDWMMPLIEGPEVVRLIRSLETECPPYLIMLTSKSSKTELVAGLDAGADDYLSKPFNRDELRTRIDVGRRIVEIQAALVKSRQAMEHQANHDPLTGMLNRRAILEQLRKELARTYRSEELLVVGMLDIDFFKLINDTYGHQTGDDILCAFAQILKDHVREYDSVGRIGGEEFLVIMPMKPGARYAEAFAKLCRRVADTNIHTRKNELSITISAGFVRATAESTVDDILEKTDKAMYLAKKEGRNRAVEYRSTDV